MQNVKYAHTLLLAVCLSLIEMNDFKELSTITTEDINIFPEKLREINMRVRKNEIADENKSIMIFILEEAEFRVALSDEKKIWENAVVPFEISDDYSSKNRNFILEAMNEFHNKTCVRFRPRRGENSYIFIMPGSGCSSGIGKQSQSNRVTLNQNCFVKGIVIHELMHTLGFLHEQNRPDRDEFVRIMPENIQEGFEGNFRKFSEDEVTLQNQTYDYGSVMHYGAFEFSKDMDSPTIVARKEGVMIGQRDGFSEKDIIKINLLYKCNETSIADNSALEDEGNMNNSTLENEESMNNSTLEYEGFLPLEEEIEGEERMDKMKKSSLPYYILT